MSALISQFGVGFYLSDAAVRVIDNLLDLMSVPKIKKSQLDKDLYPT